MQCDMKAIENSFADAMERHSKLVPNLLNAVADLHSKLNSVLGGGLVECIDKDQRSLSLSSVPAPNDDGVFPLVIRLTTSTGVCFAVPITLEPTTDNAFQARLRGTSLALMVPGTDEFAQLVTRSVVGFLDNQTIPPKAPNGQVVVVSQADLERDLMAQGIEIPIE